ncbi:outer membrane protein assembly factor BamD [Acuticoccus sp. I52.16.1]|uniref:outer membrane protein assembly factor BamD n=1 Tax=Acuticoccus sp. I52.16.1 TaxID=2928472 RepID=UPI001FD25FA6|nr:outer membrane protein assembly factor BamD [Acuticoccus sp. I52.16.1]UOM33620.1 outer membrane protein assembly factor BamD [Acuticoccus sp. I52.16.1]
MVMRLTRPLAALILVVGLGACGSRVTELDFDERPADQLYNEALVLMNEGDYRTAQLKFEEVDRLHPHSDLGRKSQVMQAFANYSRGRYTDASVAAKRFIALNPGSPDAAYAQYIIAMSYYRQIPDVTRDQDGTRRALEAFEVLIEKYPDSEYVDEARRKYQQVQDQIAGHEMEIGRYYLERKENLAAINRFRVVVEKYQRTNQIEEALFRLTESYYALGLTQEAQTAAAVLGHNFPDSRWYKDAYTLLETGGFSPEENKSSWISRAFKGFNVL